MPGKSRRGRGKYSHSKKRKRERHSRPAVVAQQTAVTQMDEPVSSPEISAPVASVPAPVAKPAVVQRSYVVNELRTIGIIAGIMLIVLIVLAVVLT